MHFFRKQYAVFIPVLFTSSLLAQSTGAPGIEQLQQQIADAWTNAEFGWMLASCALVLMMTGPGLELFYGDLVRRKNVLSTMMHSFAMMGIITVLWESATTIVASGP